jgi:hypothetical protein
MPAAELPAWVASWRPDPLWAGTPMLPRDDLALLFSGVEHRAWILQMEKYLTGESEQLPPLAPDQCRFGAWLDTDGFKRYGALPAFNEVRSLHDQVHAMARDLCDLRDQARNPEMLAGLAGFHARRDALLAHVRHLLQQHPDAGPPWMDAGR